MRAHAWARGLCTPIAAAASIMAGACGSDPVGLARTPPAVPLTQAPDQATGAFAGRPAAEAHVRGQGEISGGVSGGAARRPTPLPSHATTPSARPVRAGGAGANAPSTRGKGLPEAAPISPWHADVHQGDPRAEGAGRRTSPMSDHTSRPPAAGREHHPPFSSTPGPLGHSTSGDSADLAVTTAAASQHGSRTDGQHRQRPGLRGTYAHFRRPSRSPAGYEAPGQEGGGLELRI